MDLHHVVAVDHDAGHVMTSGAIGDVLHRGHVFPRGELTVQVVLADKDDRQLPGGGDIEGLVEHSLVRGAVAEEAGRHFTTPTDLGRQSRAGGDRQAGADDAVGT